MHPIFAIRRNINIDQCSDKAVPVSLLLLCDLRYLGRDWTFDNIEEATAITNGEIFHKFIDNRSIKLFKRCVLTSPTKEKSDTLIRVDIS